MHHVIDFSVDRIRQEPVIEHTETSVESKKGTRLRVQWPDSPRSNLHAAKAKFLQMAADYTWLNPHLMLSLDWFGEHIAVDATAQDWPKWKPSDPTRAHWYTSDRLERLIAGYIANGATSNRTIREFVSEFRGLSGSAKQKAVLDKVGLSRELLTALVVNNATLPRGSLSDQGRAVLAAVGTGELAPGQGAALLGAIGTLARVTELDELMARITKLEDKQNGNT